ncbi:MAG TPA: sensor histidine kinase [Bacteroidetes bacterium]|nr:sensor histidine kinase [Bacteroidota bacterium]
MPTFVAHLSKGSPWIDRLTRALPNREVQVLTDEEEFNKTLRHQRAAVVVLSMPDSPEGVERTIREVHKDRNPLLFPVLFLANRILSHEDWAASWRAGAFGVLTGEAGDESVVSRLRDLLVIQRGGVLQQTLLAFSEELRSLTEIQPILQRVADVIHDELDWGRVLISLRDVNRGLTGPKALAGFTPEETKKVLSRPPRPSLPKEKLDWYREEYRISNSFFIPAEASHPWTEERVFYGTDMGEDGDAWRAEDFLIVPIESGDLFLGYISVDNPRGGKRPNFRQIKELELIAYQAAGAISSYFLTEDIKKRYQILEIEVKRRSEELERMSRYRRELELRLMEESRLSSIGLMAAGIAHNLKGPLTAIKGFADLARIAHPGDENVQRILKNVSKMQDAIDNLMRKAHRHRSDKMSEVAINNLIEDEVQSLGAYPGAQDVQFRLCLDAKCGSVACNVSDLTQILGNLLRNAVDAVWDRPEKTVVIRSKRNHNEVTIEITDSGPGIPSEFTEKLFEPFFSTKRKPEDEGRAPIGTGIGLYTVRQAAERSGYKVRYSSRENAGATFTVSIPT